MTEKPDFSLKDMNEKLNAIYGQMKDEEVKRLKKKEYKVAGFKVKAKRAIKQNKMLCLILRNNKTSDFKIAKVVGGIINIDDQIISAYESDAVFIYKKLPFMVLFEWRLTPVGGKTEEEYAKQLIEVGGTKSLKFAKINELMSHAAQTIITAIKQAKLDMQKTKKKINPIVLIIGAAILLAVIGGMMGWI